MGRAICEAGRRRPRRCDEDQGGRGGDVEAVRYCKGLYWFIGVFSWAYEGKMMGRGAAVGVKKETKSRKRDEVFFFL